VAECARCLYDERHPFGLVLDAEGICSGCRVHQEKSELDWSRRLDLLSERIAARPRRSRWYDCVVPVRGTPEYFIVLDIVVNRLGLRPLVVAYNTQFNSRVGIRNVDLMRETFDVDVELYASNPITYRKLVRESLVRMASVRWPLLAGVTQFPVRTAVDKRIPLVIWPYHQPTEQVGTHSYLEECAMSRRDRHEYDLMGMEPDELVTTDTLLTRRDVEDLRYPSDAELAREDVIGLYLSNYVPWDSRRYSEDAIERFGAVSAVNPRTFDPYDRIDDMTYMTAHDLLKQAKLGYSRVTDDLVREIRFGRVDRSVALELVAHHERHFPSEELRVFLDWLGMSEDALRWLLRRLPHGEPTDASVPPLSAAAEAFLASFVVNGGAVHDPLEFTIFGKGLELADRALRPVQPD
jgi:N-acetyl sugar amidotransferase